MPDHEIRKLETLELIAHLARSAYVKLQTDAGDNINQPSVAGGLMALAHLEGEAWANHYEALNG